MVSDYHGKRTHSRAMGILQTSVYAGTVGGGYWAGSPLSLCSEYSVVCWGWDWFVCSGSRFVAAPTTLRVCHRGLFLFIP